jgi:SAM-dependent methyltransferase
MRLRGQEVNGMTRDKVPSKWGARLILRVYLWACERLYHELAWWYDRVSWIVSVGQWRRWQAGVWQEVHGSDVLEIGFGTGELLAQGAQQGLAIVGLDRSPVMVEVARQRATKRDAPFRATLGDGHALPFERHQFDTVMATFPAGYILDLSTLAEIRRVLRAEGRLVLLGLWVDLHLGRIGRWLPVFYGRPGDASLEAIVRRVCAAGFRARWVEQRHGQFTVGLLVADRE